MFGTTLSVKINVPAFEEALKDEFDGFHFGPEEFVLLVEDVGAKLKLVTMPKKLSDFSLFVQTVTNLKRSVEKVVVLVETYSNKVKTLTSEQKKNLAVDMLDALFEFPMVLEMVDQSIFAILVSFVVDDMNTQFGGTWSNDIINKIMNR